MLLNDKPILEQLQGVETVKLIVMRKILFPILSYFSYGETKFPDPPVRLGLS